MSRKNEITHFPITMLRLNFKTSLSKYILFSLLFCLFTLFALLLICFLVSLFTLFALLLVFVLKRRLGKGKKEKRKKGKKEKERSKKLK